MDDVNSNDNNGKQMRNANEKNALKKITKHKTINLFPMKKTRSVKNRFLFQLSKVGPFLTK